MPCYVLHMCWNFSFSRWQKSPLHQIYFGFVTFPPPSEDFTLPHRFLVLPPGINMDSWSPPGVHVEFLWQGAQPNFYLFPPGFHLVSRLTPWTPLHGLHMESMEFAPFHITLHSNFHLSVDSSSLNNIFCRYWFINKNQVTWWTKK